MMSVYDPDILVALQQAVNRYQYFGRQAFLDDGLTILAASRHFPTIGIPRSSVFHDAIAAMKTHYSLDDWRTVLNAAWPSDRPDSMQVRLRAIAKDINYQTEYWIDNDVHITAMQLRDWRDRLIRLADEM